MSLFYYNWKKQTIITGFWKILLDVCIVYGIIFKILKKKKIEQFINNWFFFI